MDLERVRLQQREQRQPILRNALAHRVQRVLHLKRQREHRLAHASQACLVAVFGEEGRLREAARLDAHPRDAPIS